LNRFSLAKRKQFLEVAGNQIVLCDFWRSLGKLWGYRLGFLIRKFTSYGNEFQLFSDGPQTLYHRALAP